MKKWFSLLCICLLSGMIASAVGVDDRGVTNDPTVNERANACYEGGTMEGKCESDAAWECGWYQIRWELNRSFGRPAFCGPSEPVAEADVCMLFGSDMMCANQSWARIDLNNNGTADILLYFTHGIDFTLCPSEPGYFLSSLFGTDLFYIRFDFPPFNVTAPFACMYTLI